MMAASSGKALNFFKEVVDVDREEFCVGEGFFVGIAFKQDAAGDFAISVLEFWKVEQPCLGVVFRDVHEILGVFHGEFEKLKELLDGTKVVFW